MILLRSESETTTYLKVIGMVSDEACAQAV